MPTGTPPTPLTAQDPAVLKYLDMMQAVINRMAANSGSCKTWCVGLVSGMLTLAYKQGSGEHHVAMLAFIPWLLFYFLDSYYLSLEKDFRKRFEGTVELLGKGSLLQTELFIIKPPENSGSRLGKVLKLLFTSVATLPFYLLLGVLIGLAMAYLH